jgi:hypothetical protein
MQINDRYIIAFTTKNLFLTHQTNIVFKMDDGPASILIINQLL